MMKQKEEEELLQNNHRQRNDGTKKNLENVRNKTSRLLLGVF